MKSSSIYRRRGTRGSRSTTACAGQVPIEDSTADGNKLRVLRMRALVTGATGFIGQHLLARLDRPIVLSRNAARARQLLEGFKVTAFDWDPVSGPPPLEVFSGVDAVFHLAGDPIAQGRWTSEK